MPAVATLSRAATPYGARIADAASGGWSESGGPALAVADQGKGQRWRKLQCSQAGAAVGRVAGQLAEKAAGTGEKLAGGGLWRSRSA
jgi:hypothetical protein